MTQQKLTDTEPMASEHPYVSEHTPGMTQGPTPTTLRQHPYPKTWPTLNSPLFSPQPEHQPGEEERFLTIDPISMSSTCLSQLPQQADFPTDPDMLGSWTQEAKDVSP